jgi:hypothetical protein
MNGDIQADNLTLAELVQDPLVALVMKSDGVDRDCVEALFKRIGTATAAGGSTAHRRLCPQS